MPDTLQPGFITLHGNQLEQLRAAVFDWLRMHPLGPLEQETFLVQSNGVAEWLKIALAQENGVCAATEVTLPGRFLWQAYRKVLGSDAVARRSAFDRAPLTWRLMRLLPALAAQPGFAPLRHFLRDGDPERRLQLAQRLADLFDQYQVYRADWLGDWARGADVLRPARGEPVALGEDQRWQALLWRAVMDSVDHGEREQGRAAVHLRFVDMLRNGKPSLAGLPRRVVVFGISALPYQNLEALAALSTRMQVLVAVPNPCRFHWGDIISGRELLGAQRRRQALRDGRDLAGVPPEELHAYSHPLLAAWGRLGRDFIRMLDEFDDDAQTALNHPALRVDLFSDDEGDCLLAQVQAAVRDMTPVREHARTRPAEDDRSIEFHVAHSAQREVEVLHDRLLSLLAEPGSTPLRPRDIIVMVPDIDVFSPAIRAVFGQYGERDRRHIPFAIADTSERQGNPLLVALDWLLRLPEQRCLQSEVRDLLDVPAIAARFGVDEADLPRLAQWIAESGVRWGLDHAHRESLGLGPAGEHNAWIFGMRRMLLGYASGNGGPWAGIEPYGEVGGLDAGLAGCLAALVSSLLEWRQVLNTPAPPAQWGERARRLLSAFFLAGDEAGRLLLSRLDQCLQAWLDDCDSAGFAEEIPLAVAREAWLGGIDEQSLTQRFVSGGVTFCTLLPMRAVPFRVVCLLGMNDGDFPRRAQRADFDLLAAPQMARPGDRARREDDRYLMLEALLSARDKLYISWCGRNVRDNTEQPPSVLVAQLRDYLAAGWDLDPAGLTVEHPLQPFSRRYFEEGGLHTWAREWLAAHEARDSGSAAPLPEFRPEPGFTLQLAALARFIRHPVRQFFRQRLQVVFEADDGGAQDDEPLAIDGLQHYQLCQQMLDDEGQPEAPDDAEAALRERAARLARRGLLPLGAAGARMQEELARELLPARRAWLTLCARYPGAAAKLRVSVPLDDELRLEDWVDRMRGDGSEEVWLMQTASTLLDKHAKTPAPKRPALIDGWLRQLAAAAMGRPVTGYLVGRDAVVVLSPLEPAEAQVTLSGLLHAWKQGMRQPLPTACRTGLTLVDGGSAAQCAQCYDGGYDNRPPAEAGEDACLARLWPDFDSLAADPGWESASRQLYGPLADWAGRALQVMPFDQISGAKEAA
ncbi:RecBCD enzyme subunit RecC [Noviherbaspirillum aridicola]|uniref:RecBCD enzyme subunit RecC n=2 Tax=Noviherbaspirillum aridicola TaxID=2849687 RepID=A0ABQ4QA95_9BURK|nr:RecBCD enzyme subunit RecC [Noviherbaspirillum aridicola]